MTYTLPDLVVAAFVAFCRVGGCFLVMPGLASVRVPVQIRIFIALAVTLGLLMHLWDTILPYVRQSPDALLVMVVSETLVGILIGLMARLFILALQFIGSAIANMLGYGAALGPAIEEPEPQAAVAAILSFSALLLLFVADFHHEIIRALVTSYRLVPPATLFDPRTALVDVTDTLSESFFVMLRLGSPFIAYGLLVNLSIGFLNKLTPQIPVYFISLPFVIAGGLILMYFAIAGFLSLFTGSFVPVTIGR